MLHFVVFGAGRIGQIHAKNIAAHPMAKVRYVVDVDAAAAKKLADAVGAKVATSAEQALADAEVNAVMIGSPTNTHVDLIVASARAKKAIFCEKPIDLDLKRVDMCLAEIEKAQVPFFVGFNRRFDPSFRALEKAVRAGEIGEIEQVIITSRDPSPPPAQYVKASGGLFRDMMIHDLDMARWLLGSEPTELYATASCMVDKAIGEQGDVDTAMVTMKTKSGALCHISNSRRAAYGYDQRIEVFGSKGMLQAGNRTATTVVRSLGTGVGSDKPLHFFLERYAEAYVTELNDFIDAVLNKKPQPVGAKDGRRALLLADLANESLAKRAAVAVPA